MTARSARYSWVSRSDLLYGHTKGLARWKPLLILPLAVVLALAFAESRTIVKPDPVLAAQETKGGTQQLSDEEVAKALKEKMLKLEQMKTENAETIHKLKAKLDETTDAAVKEKIQAELQKQKVVALEIGAKEGQLRMKKLEFAISKETDGTVKAKLAKEFEAVKAKTEDYARKAEDLRKADAGAEKNAADKKIEK